MKAILISLILLLCAGVFSFQKSRPSIQWRIENEEMFSDCKKNAKTIIKHGVFKLCEQKDLSVGFGAANVFEYIVYDTTGAFVANKCNVRAFTKIKETKEMYIINQLPFTVEELGKNYYLLTFIDAMKDPGFVCN